MQYKIVKGSDRGSLEHFVNSHLEKGWKPLGGVAVDDSEKFIVYYMQAMIKE